MALDHEGVFALVSVLGKIVRIHCRNVLSVELTHEMKFFFFFLTLVFTGAYKSVGCGSVVRLRYEDAVL